MFPPASRRSKVLRGFTDTAPKIRRPILRTATASSVWRKPTDLCPIPKTFSQILRASCATFIIKNRLSQNNGHLSAGADSSTASESTGTSATEPVNPDTEATEEPAAEPTETQTTAAPTETQTTTAAASPAYQTLKTGDKNKNVTEMQKRLAALGYIDDKSCTGYFGEYTEKIVRRFQKKAGLPETGIADSETLTRLYADDAPKWK